MHTTPRHPAKRFEKDVVLIDDRYEQHLRWLPGERLHHVFEQTCDRLQAEGHADRLAVDGITESVTYAELDARANQLAHVLIAGGVQPGDRVGLLVDEAMAGYLGMLGISKASAVYVPLDAGIPFRRLADIAEDSGLTVLLTQSHLRERSVGIDVTILALDELAQDLAAQPRTRPDEKSSTGAVAGDADLAYIIYTSGTTGVPKGVPIEHVAICNFLHVAAEVYELNGQDRMYQGMTIAFDFSVEEIWLSWTVGATLVPKPAGGALLGRDLHDFLVGAGVTAMSCVPTLLATLEWDLPDLRFLLVSGEACPADLVERWDRPGRRFLNVYGPTEATVTATWTPLTAGRKVTIGVPLPTYAVVILDPEEDDTVPRGAEGEIAIGGVALSPGYLNRPEQTAKAFIEDPVGVPNNPSGRLYRTGDLGRIGPNGEIDYLGRIDTQVKIRGYRIELSEIETVAMACEGIAAAVVEPYRDGSQPDELVAYVVRRAAAPPLDRAALLGQMRDRLPAYMVPAFVEELPVLPLLPSNKVDRKALPPPTAPRVTREDGEYVAPVGALEESMTAALETVLNVPRISVEADFFDELAVSSILMATYCAQLRRLPGLASVGMSDLYRNASVRQLAAAMAARVGAATIDAPALADGLGADVGTDAATDSATPSAPSVAARVSAVRYALCGLAQATAMTAYAGGLAIGTLLIGGPAQQATNDIVQLYLRTVLLSLWLAGYTIVLPVLLKWLLIGRWRARDIPLWSATYVRFWIVRMLLRASPVRLLVGSPLYPLYLRALGAKVGRRVLILAPAIPVVTDLLSIGSDTVIRQDVVFPGYRVDGGLLRTGPVTIGSRAYVGTGATLDIDTTIGDAGQLAHASALLPGQHLPDGERWHGVPGCPAATRPDYRRGPELPASGLRALLFGAGQVLSLVAGVLPLLEMLVLVAAERVIENVVVPRFGSAGVTWWEGAAVVGTVAAVATVLIVLLGQVVVFTVPRLLSLGVREGVDYRLYGWRYTLHRGIIRLTNFRFFNSLFGDSSYIVGYLARLGYRLRPVQQTGSNFGMAVTQESPYASVIGTGSIVSDGLAIANADYSSTGFRVGLAGLGRRVFVGNNVVLPAGARLGDDLLLATKVMVPLEGEVRQGVGLLGSPSFPIPLPSRPAGVAVLERRRDLREALRRKNRVNRHTMALFLVNRIMLTWILLGLAVLALVLGTRLGTWAAVLAFAPTPWLMAWYAVFAERLALGFRALQPMQCSLYDRRFWHHERFWKLSANAALIPFDGTPFKSWYLRALGVRVGRRLFDDGAGIVEKSMVTIGDYCSLNQMSVLQGHSLENRVFTSDGIVVGDHVTLGVRAFAHYGTTLGDGVRLDTDSFLMKGEQVPDGHHWEGNPAGPRTSRIPPRPVPVLEGVGHGAR